MSSCMYKGTDRKHCPKNPCNQTGPYEADEEDCALLLCSKHRIVMQTHRAAKKEHNENAKKKRKAPSSSSSQPVSISQPCGHSTWLRESTARLQNELANPDGKRYNTTIQASDLFAKDADGRFTCQTSLQQLLLATGFVIVQGALPHNESKLDEIMAGTRGAWESIANKVCIFHSIYS